MSTVTASDPHRVDSGNWIVWAVAFSPDGRQIAAGSGRRVQLWDLADKNLVWEQTIARWRGEVYTVAVSPDGRRLAGGSGKRLLVWDLASRQLVWEKTIGRRLADVDSVAFSPDGTRLAAATADTRAATTRVWDAASGEQLLTLQHDAPAMAVTFSPDGARLAIGGSDGTGGVWDAATGKRLLKVRHREAINAVAFCPNGQRFATASDDGTARVWDATSGAQMVHVSHGDGSKAVAFSPDGQRIATGGDDPTAWVWDAATGDRLLEIEHGVTANAVAFSPDGQRLALGCSSGVFVADCPPEARPSFRSAGSTHPSTDRVVGSSRVQLSSSDSEDESDLLGDLIAALLMAVILAVPAGLLPWLLLGVWLSGEEIWALYPESAWQSFVFDFVFDEEAAILWFLLVLAAGMVVVQGIAALFPPDPLRQWRQTAIALVAPFVLLAVAAASSVWALRVLDRLS